MDSKLYKDQYEFEWNHRSQLTSMLNIPIVVTTVMGGALVALFQKFQFAKDLPTYFFIIFASVSLVGLATAIVFLFKAVLGYRYQRIPTPMKIKAHYDDLLEWWKRNNGSEENAKIDLNDFMNVRLAEAVEKNSENNKNKSANIYKSNVALIIAFVFIALCSIPYLIKTTNNSSNTIKVEIVNTGLTLIQKEEKGMPENEQQQPTNEQTDDDPKPVGPPNEEIREGDTTSTEKNSSTSED